MSQSATMDLLQVAADMRASGQWLASLRVMDEAAPDFEYVGMRARSLTTKHRRIGRKLYGVASREWQGQHHVLTAASFNAIYAQRSPSTMVLNPLTYALFRKRVGGGSLEG